MYIASVRTPKLEIPCNLVLVVPIPARRMPASFIRTKLVIYSTFSLPVPVASRGLALRLLLIAIHASFLLELTLRS